MGNYSSNDKNYEYSYTALGRHSNLKFKNKANKVTQREQSASSFNSKIFKEIFTPERFKNTKLSIHIEKQTIEESLNIDLSSTRTNTLTCESQNINRTGDHIRHNYIAKLIYTDIWQPSAITKIHNSLIIFDWDDTLLPTTFITPNGIFSEEIEFSQYELDRVTKLEDNVFKLISLAIKSGDVYIVTNAAPGWVEYSCHRFYPRVSGLLNSIRIISARGQFEKKHPGDNRQWKIEAYLYLLNTLDINLITNICCIGDSIIEMEAAHILASKFCHAYIKTIKFREYPKPEEIGKQIILVINQFDKIIGSVKNLTIRVDKKSKL